MPVFEYSAIDKSGKKLKGMIEAVNEDQVRKQLRSSDKYPTSLTEHVAKQNRSFQISLFQKTQSKEIYSFTRQLATLLKAGIPLIDSLTTLIEQTDNKHFKKVISSIKEDINEGASLTTSLQNHKNLFTNIYISMIRAGEASGSLAIVLERIAEYGENQQALRAKFKAALIYPIFMSVIGVIILIVLLTYIIPSITQVFIEMDQLLPLPTILLINLSSSLQKFWWVILISLFSIFIVLKHFIHTPLGKTFWDLLKLRFFVVGKLTRKIILARFSSTLSNLLGSGVNLVSALQISKVVINNVHVAEVIEKTIQNVEKGEGLTIALSESPWFTPTFIQMLQVGEKSGNVEEMLENLSETYQREVDTALTGVTSLIEPLMVVFMGCVVGFVVLSILLPIFEMNQMIR